MELSKKEQELYNLIKESDIKVTSKVIEEKLGNSYLGSLGKLIDNNLIESEKYRPKKEREQISLPKKIKYYKLKEE